MKPNAEFLCLALVVSLFGCATRPVSDTIALQGTWQGPELGVGQAGACRLIVSGRHFEFHGADTNEWYKGTFTLREDTRPRRFLGTVEECPLSEYVGKTSQAIYELSGHTLRLTAGEPGRPGPPPNFESADARRFLLTR